MPLLNKRDRIPNTVLHDTVQLYSLSSLFSPCMSPLLNKRDRIPNIVLHDTVQLYTLSSLFSPCMSPLLNKRDRIPNIVLTLPLDEALSDIEGK